MDYSYKRYVYTPPCNGEPLNNGDGSVGTTEGDVSGDDETLSSSPPSTRRRTFLLVKDMVLTFLALLGLIVLVSNAVYPRHDGVPKGIVGYAIPRKPCYCGESVAEARSRGCKYDSLCAAWLPDHCRDDELTAEFETTGDGPDGNWLYYADKNHTKLLTMEQVAELADDPLGRFHMSPQWHVIHCFFFWRLEHRARLNGKFVEARSDNERHIIHCQKIINDPGPGSVSGVALDADFDAGAE